MNTVAIPLKTQQFAIIPLEEENAIVEFDRTLTSFRERLADPQLSGMMRGTIQAKAIITMKQMITPAMMKDFKALMNSPLGFKTDRPPGVRTRDGRLLPPYDDETIKDVLIVGFLQGAKCTGDEINIIGGNCYLTKKFYRPAVLAFPGMTELQLQLGVPQVLSDRVALVEASATWKVNGRAYFLECFKGKTDLRIPVKCYESSGPDEILGKAERKLYARIFSFLTGLNFDPELQEEGILAIPKTVEAAAVVAASPGSVNSLTDETADSDEQTAETIVRDFGAQLHDIDQIVEVQRALSNRHQLVDSAEWSDELKLLTKARLGALAKSKSEEIRAARGFRSNGQPPTAAA